MCAEDEYGRELVFLTFVSLSETAATVLQLSGNQNLNVTRGSSKSQIQLPS